MLGVKFPGHFSAGNCAEKPIRLGANLNPPTEAGKIAEQSVNSTLASG